MDPGAMFPASDVVAQNLPTPTHCIPQVSPTDRPSLFAYKDDPLYQCILKRCLTDKESSMPELTRCGLANNIHFLIMRDLRDAHGAQYIIEDGMVLETRSTKDHHQANFTVNGASVRGLQTTIEGLKIGDRGLTIAGNDVREKSQALESLRKTVDLAIHQDWEADGDDESMSMTRVFGILLDTQN
jgi:hypothetical protein